MLRSILGESTDDNAMTLQFKLLCSKTFVLAECMLGQLSLQERSFHTLAFDEWALSPRWCFGCLPAFCVCGPYYLNLFPSSRRFGGIRNYMVLKVVSHEGARIVFSRSF